ncbi:MAG: dihydroneopterin 2',3'-cyclic phosphate phosphodiesterase [Candidatus Altiarchaeales archaeon]|nr:MAG: dihydroneopterin 2',3'-cyclic phosphate phosphodiesterase [Candidatus Altiarchaeales archaeon]
MGKLIKLAEKIKDEELRKKVVDFLKDPKLSHKDFKKYPRMKIEEAGSIFTVSSPSGSISVERDVLNHTIAVTELCLKTAEVLEKNYGIKVNKDYLIAASLLHDSMKIFEWKKGEKGLEPTGVLLDHTMLAVAEFYHRGFPEEVIHIIASHFGETGPTPPRTIEAVILHYCDSFLSMIEFQMRRKEEPLQLVIFDEESLKKIAEKVAKEEIEKFSK